MTNSFHRNSIVQTVILFFAFPNSLPLLLKTSAFFLNCCCIKQYGMQYRYQHSSGTLSWPSFFGLCLFNYRFYCAPCISFKCDFNKFNDFIFFKIHILNQMLKNLNKYNAHFLGHLKVFLLT